MRLNEQFIKNALPEVSLTYTVFPEITSYSIDSRTVQPGDMFVALQGAKVDGHNFVHDALKKGAIGIIINHDKSQCLQDINKAELANKLIMIVPDTKSAIVQLATAWRKQFAYPVIGVTGSVGKTTTKEILERILTLHGYRCIVSEGNQNTLIGLSLRILQMTDEFDVALFEMGISKRGEMTQLVDLVQPTNGIITTIGHAHMEGLGSILDIASEKRVLFSRFKENNIGVINGDQTLLSQISYSHPVVKFGAKTTNQVQARKISTSGESTSFVLKMYGQKEKITIQSSHTSAVFNSLAAASMAYLLNVPFQTIVQGIQELVKVQGRYEQRSLKQGNGVVINDCYNASPESMKAALIAFQKYETKAQKIAVLGDMLELGVNSPFWHRQLGRFLRKVPSLNHVILVGSMVQWTKKTMPVNLTVEQVPTWQDALTALEKSLDKDSVVLVKGSRGMGLKNLVDSVA